MKAPEGIANQINEKTSDELLAMFKQPDDWLPETLDVAKAELQRRGIGADKIPVAPAPVPQSRGAYALQGIGTTFYGKRDFQKNGSYITTEWIVFLFVPIIPLRSLRVLEKNSENLFFYQRHEYAVYEKSFPNLKQVFCIYAYVFAYYIWFSSLLTHSNWIAAFSQNWFSRSTSEYILATVVLFGIAVPAIIPLILRWHARKNVEV